MNFNYLGSFLIGLYMIIDIWLPYRAGVGRRPVQHQEQEI